MPWIKCVPIFNKEIIGLCGTPYHAHPQGCHNFCKRPSCPPTMLPLDICLDDFYIIYTKFAIGQHVKALKHKHPEWSIYQLQNVLYWQPRARKILQGEVDTFLSIYPGYRVLGPTMHLDSYGIDMTATLKPFQIDLDWGLGWGLRDYTYVLRYAGTLLEKASRAHLQKLYKQYPDIYDKRVGICAGCRYRPCLKLMRQNPHLYVKKRFGTVVIQRFVADLGWVVACDCGKYRLVAIRKLFCQEYLCSCQQTTPKHRV